MAKEILKREDVPIEKRWALEDLFKSDEEWETQYAKFCDDLSDLAAFKGHLGESAKELLSYLDLEDDFSIRLEKLFMYANLSSDVDTTNSTYQTMLMRAQTAMSEFGETTSFATPEIMEIPEQTLEDYRKSDERFRLYDRYFTLLERQRPHTCSKEVEQVLASAQEISQAPGNIFTMFNNADISFPDITDENGEQVHMTNARFVNYEESADRNVRKAAFDSLYSGYKQFSNTLAATYSANVKRAQFMAKARGYKSTRNMYTFENNVPEEVYDNLISTVHEGLPAMYRYVSLRKKMLGVDELHMYDVYVPIVPECEMDITYDEAVDTILEALKPMGETYLNAMREGFDNHWIDSCENVGKRTGAYCSGGSVGHPYVLMSWQNSLDSMFTLAHEMGHAMHSYFSVTTQPHQTAEYVIFVAEVASTCNEMLLTDYLLKTTTDKDKRAYILNHFLDTVKGTFYRQTMFAEFEMKSHAMSEAGQALTAQNLSDMYYDLNKLYFGPDMVSDDAIRYEWSRIPHFYTPFYVYQYATGISAAIALSERILTEGESAVNDYFKFLTGGGSMDPIDLLKLAGVDMSSPEPVRETIRCFEKRLDELEELLL